MAADSSTTLRRIYDGALVALARRGVHKLSMSDICNASGVARGTLYRYFKTKEDVLTAIAEHVEQGMLQALANSVEEQPELESRVHVVVSSMLSYGDTHPEMRQVLVAEPGFAMGFIRTVFPKFVDAAEELLSPALEVSPAVRSGAVSIGQLSELILRAAATGFFIPPADNEAFERAVETLPGLLAGSVAPQ